MLIPDSAFQLGAIVVFLLPGVTFSTVRTWSVGYRSIDHSVGYRILDALYVGIVFDAVYVLLLWPWLAPLWFKSHDPVRDFGWTGALFVLLLFAVVPGLVATLMYRYRFSRTKVDGKKRLRLVKRSSYRPVPTAWDQNALHMREGRFVRVKVESGTYYGGWFGTRSYVSTYPQPHDMYIESQWKMGQHGEFEGRMVGTAGIWLMITDKCVVEWQEPPPED